MLWTCTIFGMTIVKFQNFRPHHVHHHKRPVRVDVTKLDYSKIDDSKNKNVNSSSSSGSKLPRINSEFVYSGTSDHIVIISQLTEKHASLEKQLQIKENQLLEKDKYVSRNEPMILIDNVGVRAQVFIEVPFLYRLPNWKLLISLKKKNFGIWW